MSNLYSCVSPLIVVPFVFLLSLMLPMTLAAEFKLALVDMRQVLNESTGAKEKRKQLETRHATMKSEIAKNRALLQQQGDDMVKRKVPPQSQEADFFRSQLAVFERATKEKEDTIERDFLAINKELSLRAYKIIKQLAEQEKIDLVFDKNDQGYGAVMYSGTITNLTDKVLQKINSPEK